MSIYVINLTRRPDRLMWMTNYYGPILNRVEAVDGSDPSLGLETSNFCTPSEAACWISHQKAMKTMIQNGDDFALILEDDAEIDPKFSVPDVILQSAKFMKENNIDLLQLGFFKGLGRKRSLLVKLRLLKQKELSLDFLCDVQPNQHGIGTHAYMISRGGAEKFIQINRPVFLAADAALMYIAQGQSRVQRIRIWQIQNSIFSQRPITSSNNSDVQSL